MIKRLPITVVAVAAAFMATGCGHTNASQGAAASIKVGTNRALGTVTPYVGNTQGYFQPMQVDIVDFADGSTLMEAFASGQLDVALLGIAPAAIWQEKGVGLKVVAGANGGGHVLLTRTDTGITDVRGLKGKKVATPKPGTVVDTLFRSHIAGDLAKLDPEHDMQIVPDVAPADMPAVLFVSREVDAAITWEPFASQAEKQFRNVRVLFDGAAEWRKLNGDAKPLYPANVMIARQAFIDGHPAVLRQFLAGYVRTIRFMNEDPGSANEIIGKEIQLDKEIVTAARKRIDYRADVDPVADLGTLEWSAKLGYLKQVPQASTLFDLSFLPKQ